MVRNFISKGYSNSDAHQVAVKAIEGSVVKQSLLLTYTDAYWVAGMIMLCSIPFLYLQKFKKGVKIPVDAH